MDENMERLYREAILFDQSDYYRSEEYNLIAERQMKDYLLMVQRFGTALLPLLEDYLTAIHEELQIEKKHAFELGYKEGKKAAKK